MILPFETHEIFITLDDGNFYRLHPDFSRTLVDSKTLFTEERFSNSRSKQFAILHKDQFTSAKSHMMNPENPQRICTELARIYVKMGFLNEEEVVDYLNL